MLTNIPQIYISKISSKNKTLYWSKSYLLPFLATIDTTFRSLHYKILPNVLFINKKLYNFETKTMCFAHFPKLWKRFPYLSLMNALMWNLFWENYRRNFRMIFFCYHLHHRLPFLNWLIKKNIYNLVNHILLIFIY